MKKKYRTKEGASKKFLEMLVESEIDVEAGYVSPAFDNAEDSIKWLNSKKPKYVLSNNEKEHNRLMKMVKEWISLMLNRWRNKK